MADGDLTEYDVPAPHTNRVRVTFNPLGVRLSFGESPDGSDKEERWNSAVHMPFYIFKNVVDILNNTLAQVEKLNSDKPEQ